jgi:hypothetical protein
MVIRDGMDMAGRKDSETEAFSAKMKGHVKTLAYLQMRTRPWGTNT